MTVTVYFPTVESEPEVVELVLVELDDVDELVVDVEELLLDVFVPPPPPVDPPLVPVEPPLVFVEPPLVVFSEYSATIVKLDSISVFSVHVLSSLLLLSNHPKNV